MSLGFILQFINWTYGTNDFVFLMYVDEAGDPGLLSNNGSPWFVLSGYVVHEMKWQEVLNCHVEFRRLLRKKYNFPIRKEFHTGELVRTRKLHDQPLNVRMSMVRDYIKFIASLEGILIFNIAIDKQEFEKNSDGECCFDIAWKLLLQRFENTLKSENFPCPQNGFNHNPGNPLAKGPNPSDRGSLICDATNEGKLIKVIRKIRVHNPIPMKGSIARGIRQIPAIHLIEDPTFKSSQTSLLIQTADVITYATYQMLNPNKHSKRHNGHLLFEKLTPRITQGGPPPTHIVFHPKNKGRVI